MIKDKINKLGNYNLENKMKSELKEIQSLDLLTFPMLLDKYEEVMCKDLSNWEKKSYLVSLFELESLESDSYTNKKKELTMEIKKFLGFRIVRTKKEKFQNVLNHY